AKVAGGYADYAKVDARLVLRIPDGVTFDVAAASVVGMTTEYHALALAGRLEPGEVVLVHGASSGVGLLAVQVARLLGAGRVFATTRTARADDLLAGLGV